VTRTYDCRDPQEREQGIAAAIDAVRRGDLIVLPTDTVYGIGADAFSPTSVQALLAAKRRGRDMPVPVLVGSWRTIDGLVSKVTPEARELVEAFWPGGLTLVVEHAPSLAWDLGDARGTVAVRMPLHPVALEVLNATGPMAVSSANVSGEPPAVNADQARDQLGWLVEVYLEAGDSADPVASTIVDVTGDVPRVLRLGAVSVDQLRAVVPDIEVPGEPSAAGAPAPAEAPAPADRPVAADAPAPADPVPPAGSAPEGPIEPAGSGVAAPRVAGEPA
jgi:tRNA threonylcarbamoyl adenosine modification protein (Sua5/YciO/YrdC/YwlC family)